MHYAINQSLIVAITDDKGVIIEVNEKFSEVSGYGRGELIGQTHKIVNSGYHSKEFFEKMWMTVRERKVWKGEIRNKAKDGSFLLGRYNNCSIFSPKKESHFSI
ncbi:PAS domain S-box protein [Peribacillus frigoritolerans]|nr:PAS domain S-box protein [Peribacillus frigoritolerans]